MNPDELIKLFHLESVASGSESFSDEDDEDSGSNDRKLNAVLQMPPAQYVQVSYFLNHYQLPIPRSNSWDASSNFITKSGSRLWLTPYFLLGIGYYELRCFGGRKKIIGRLARIFFKPYEIF
jgi:hypothetical protein